MPGARPLPPPIDDTSAKLVNDAAHPLQHLQPGDIRGPCPGLNTLASHGYINRNGVVTPAEIITAVQEGFNMGYHFASFLAYSFCYFYQKQVNLTAQLYPNATPELEAAILKANLATYYQTLKDMDCEQLFPFGM